MAEAYWKCPVCGFEAHNEAEKMKHMEETKNDQKHKEGHGGEMEGGAKCPMCGATFNTKEELDKHAKGVHHQ
ncbi:hypothetical protein HYU93_00150 [Candidatus Daviesbacteria bacterium]|nr:hypothetical protein [Candidatus Daviesbacteria bacterium]